MTASLKKTPKNILQDLLSTAYFKPFYKAKKKINPPQKKEQKKKQHNTCTL